jgi:hypothetical protein
MHDLCRFKSAPHSRRTTARLRACQADRSEICRLVVVGEVDGHDEPDRAARPVQQRGGTFRRAEIRRTGSLRPPRRSAFRAFADPSLPLCRRSQWRQRKWSRPIEEREVAYFEQLRCSMRQIDRILDAVAKSPAGPDAIVVIHGDHGSRITDLDPNTEHRGRYTKAQMVAAFNTLFAVRGPKIAPGYDESPARVSHLVEDLGRSEFGTLPVDRSDDAPSVVLEDLDWKPRARVPFPATW